MGVLARPVHVAAEQQVAGVTVRDAPRRRERGVRGHVAFGDADPQRTLGLELVEFLDLEEPTLDGGLLDLAEPGVEVVDECHVGDRPRAGVERRPHRSGEDVGLVLGEHPTGVTAGAAGIGEPEEHLTRVHRSPPRVHERLDVAVVDERRDELLAVGVPILGAPDLRPRVGGERKGHRLLRGVAVVAPQHLGPHAVQSAAFEAHGTPGHHRPQRVGCPRDRVARGPREHPPDAEGALERRGGRGVETLRRAGLDDVAEGAQRDGVLAEGGQDPFDVGGVRRGRAGDEHTAALEPPTVAVEQVGGAVEGDDGLAGAGAPRDLGDAPGGGADRLVLMRLDGRDDVAHVRASAAAERRHEGALAEDDEVVGGVGDHEVVLGPDDPVSPRTQHATAQDVLGVHGRRPVERRGGRGAPVDDEGFVLVVAHAETADVPHLAAVGVLHVEPSEHEPLVLTFEVVAAQPGAEDEGVTGEQPGHLLVADVAGAVGAPPRHALGLDERGALAGLAQFGEDTVDVRLLDREFAREDVGRLLVPPIPALARVGAGHDAFAH